MGNTSGITEIFKTQLKCSIRETFTEIEIPNNLGPDGHPRVNMKIDIVIRENKILTHGLNEKNPTIM